MGERLKELRLERKWSLRQLGARAKLAGAYIQQLEAGTRENPSVEMTRRLAGAFGLTVSEFIGEKEPPVRLTNEDMIDILARERDLSPGDLEAALEWLAAIPKENRDIEIQGAKLQTKQWYNRRKQQTHETGTEYNASVEEG